MIVSDEMKKSIKIADVMGWSPWEIEFLEDEVACNFNSKEGKLKGLDAIFCTKLEPYANTCIGTAQCEAIRERFIELSVQHKDAHSFLNVVVDSI